MHNPILGAASTDKWVERLSKEHNLLPYWVNLCRGPRRGLKTWSDPHGLGGAGEGLCTVLPPPGVQCSAASEAARPPPKGRRPTCMPANAPAPAPASTTHAPRVGESAAGLTETLEIIGELEDITDAIQLAKEEGIPANTYAGLDLAAMKTLLSEYFEIIGELDDITDAIQLAKEEGIAATAYAGLDLAAMKVLLSKHFF